MEGVAAKNKKTIRYEINEQNINNDEKERR